MTQIKYRTMFKENYANLTAGFSHFLSNKSKWKWAGQEKLLLFDIVKSECLKCVTLDTLISERHFIEIQISLTLQYQLHDVLVAVVAKLLLVYCVNNY